MIASQTRRLATLLAALALSVGCGGDSTSPGVSVTGQWVGVVGSQVLTLVLAEQAGAVSGTATLTNTSTGTRALSVTGVYTAPTLSVTMTSGSLAPVNLTATVATQTMDGALQGSGFTGQLIALNRCGGSFACAPGAGEPVVRGVTVSPASATIARGASFTFGAAVDADPPLSRAVTWSSTGGVGISVNQNGVAAATASASGAATICARSVADPNVQGCAQIIVVLP